MGGLIIGCELTEAEYGIIEREPESLIGALIQVEQFVRWLSNSCTPTDKEALQRIKSRLSERIDRLAKEARS